MRDRPLSGRFRRYREVCFEAYFAIKFSSVAPFVCAQRTQRDLSLLILASGFSARMLILELLLLNLRYLRGARYRFNRHFSRALRANLSA